MAYYPKSQIKTGFYAYSKADSNDNMSLFVYKGTDTIYEGPYFATSNGQYYSGLSPSAGNNYEIEPYIDPQNDIDINNSLLTTENAAYSFNYNINLDPYYGAPASPNYLGEQIKYDTKIIPGQGINLPTPKDYQIGEFRRYFCKKTNELKYLELDKIMFDKIVKQDPLVVYYLYTPFFLSWKLTGKKEEVAKVNKNIVELTSKRYNLKQFNNFLGNDYTKYYKP